MSKINKIRVDGVEYDVEDLNAIHIESDPTVPSYVKNISENDISSWNNKSEFSGNYDDLTNKPDLSGFITKDVNNLTNYYKSSETYTKTEVDNKISSVYKYKGTVSTYGDLPSTGLTAGDVYNVETADPTHSISAGDNVAWTGTAWDKLSGNVDLSGYQTKIDSTHKLSSDLVDDTNNTNLFVTSSEKTTWSGKQDALVSGTNIKTINSTSILGSGDITTATSQDIVNDKLIGSSAPTTATVGYIGQTYTDTANNNQYVCTAINQSLGEYTWVQINGGGSSEPEPYIINISSNTITPNSATITPIFLQRIEDYINKNTPLNLFVNSYNQTNYYGKYYQGYSVPLIANVGDLSTGSNKTIYLYTSFPSIAIINEVSVLSYIMLYVQNVTISQDSSGYHFSTERTFSPEYTYCVGDIYSGANNTPHIRNYEGSVPFTTSRLALTTVNSKAYTPSGDYNPATKKYVDDYLTTLTGYDATKTQVLKNVNGTLTWQDD